MEGDTTQGRWGKAPKEAEALVGDIADKNYYLKRLAPIELGQSGRRRVTIQVSAEPIQGTCPDLCGEFKLVACGACVATLVQRALDSQGFRECAKCKRLQAIHEMPEPASETDWVCTLCVAKAHGKRLLEWDQDREQALAIEREKSIETEQQIERDWRERWEAAISKLAQTEKELAAIKAQKPERGRGGRGGGQRPAAGRGGPRRRKQGPQRGGAARGGL